MTSSDPPKDPNNTPKHTFANPAAAPAAVAKWPSLFDSPSQQQQAKQEKQPPSPFQPAAFAAAQSGPSWTLMPHSPCSSWFTCSDAGIIMLIKRFVIESGGDLAHIDSHSRLSLLELAAFQRLPGKVVFDFLLKHGAPIVVVTSQKERHDAFLALCRVPTTNTAACHETRLQVLQRYLDTGYELTADTLVNALRFARSEPKLHAFLLQLHERVTKDKLVVMPTHFASPCTPAQALLELDHIDSALSVPACARLFDTLIQPATTVSIELLRRLRPIVPDADSQLCAWLADPARALPAELLQEVLTVFEPLDWPPETRAVAVIKALQINAATQNLKLVALAFDRTQIDVNDQLDGATPLNLSLAAGASKETVQLLLAKGANVNGCSASDGSTPLHVCRSAELDELLVRAGADPSTVRWSDDCTPAQLVHTTTDYDRRWFYVKELPVIMQHRKHAELLDICIAIAPLLHEFPPEVIDKIVIDLPGMAQLDEGMRYSLVVRVGAAHAKKLDGETVELPARDPIAIHQPIALKELPSDEALAAEPQTRRRAGNESDDSTTHVGGDLSTLVADLMSSDTNASLPAVTKIRRLLSIENNPPIEDVLAAGALPRLVQLAATGTPQLQFEAAWAITNICSGSTAHVTAVLSCGAMPVLTQLLCSPSEDVAEQAVWGIGNIAGDSPQTRDFVLQLPGLVDKLIELATSSTKLSMLRNITWTMSNLCRGKPQPDRALVRPLLPVLARLIHSTDEEVVTDACWALSYLSDGRNNAIQDVIESGVGRRMVELLMHASFSVQTPALRCIGNLVTGDDLQTQFVLNLGVMPCLLALMASPKKGIRKETVWAISNITAGNKQQIQAVIGANVVPPLLQLLRHSDFDIKKEVAWAISNLSSGGSREQIQFIVTAGAVPAMAPLLTAVEPRIVLVALEFFKNVLASGASDSPNPYVALLETDGVVDTIEQLQNHPNSEIYEQAVSLLETHLAVEVESEVTIADPEKTKSPTSFSF